VCGEKARITIAEGGYTRLYRISGLNETTRERELGIVWILTERDVDGNSVPLWGIKEKRSGINSEHLGVRHRLDRT
jgi:hypothetical protein